MTTFKQAVKDEHPLQVVGAINANHALLAKRAGYKAVSYTHLTLPTKA